VVTEIESKVHGVLVSAFVDTDHETYASITITERKNPYSTRNTPDDLREIAQMLENFADTIEANDDTRT